MVEHYSLFFALLWGYTLCELRTNPGEGQEAFLAGLHFGQMLIESEFDTLMTSWAEEFVASDEDDSEEFFDKKLKEYFKRTDAEQEGL